MNPAWPDRHPQRRTRNSQGSLPGGCVCLLVVLLALSPALPTLADEVITNVMSSVVSYQYPERLHEAGTPVTSPTLSYLYFEWPGDDVASLLSSPDVSYYYQFLDAPPLVIVPTNRTPIAPEITPTVVFSNPYPQQLKLFSNGVLTTNVPPDTGKMTIVLTHGWNASPDDPNGWVTNMARQISLNVAGSPNILVWDWTSAAKSTPCLSWQADFVAAARQTPDQGFTLGAGLLSELGTNYSQPIHFIGHSLGTLVNSYAAIWMHNRGFDPMNTHLTLFDEAEVSTNPFASKPYYYRPLPSKFRWADNYITAFGLLHPNAHNVILTNGFPGNAANLPALKDQLTTFHRYPCVWYAATVSSDVSAMGHRWSFERDGFDGAPSTNTVFLQSFDGSFWNLTETNYAAANDYLDQRLQEYRDAIKYAAKRKSPSAIVANGIVYGEVLVGLAVDGFILYLQTSSSGAQSPQFRPLGAQPDGGGSGGNGNVGAYAWLPLPIPADAISMSFDFKVDGDWQDDSLAAAFNGTNVLLLTASQVETNTTLNSGLFDVTAYAGQTNEFFVGIVGGTSSNALLTVGNVVFYTALPPSLYAEVSGSKLIVWWPLTAHNFALESTTNLSFADSWMLVTNVPNIVNLQNTITNDASTGSRFYRLRKP
jgi:pimeloyl-ACP methyl ester carboxylesterase